MEQLNLVSVYGNRWFTVKDVAQMLEVTSDTVRRWIRNKKLYAIKEKGKKAYNVNGLVLRKFILDYKPEYENALIHEIKVRTIYEHVAMVGFMAARSLSKSLIEKIKERRRIKEQNESKNELVERLES